MLMMFLWCSPVYLQSTCNDQLPCLVLLEQDSNKRQFLTQSSQFKAPFQSALSPKFSFLSSPKARVNLLLLTISLAFLTPLSVFMTSLLLIRKPSQNCSHWNPSSYIHLAQGSVLTSDMTMLEVTIFAWFGPWKWSTSMTKQRRAGDHFKRA